MRATKAERLTLEVLQRAESLLAEQWQELTAEMLTAESATQEAIIAETVAPDVTNANELADSQHPTVLLYAALPDEVPTLRLIEDLCRKGWGVVLPCVVGPTELELRLCRKLDDLEVSGPYHIPEPRGPLFTLPSTLDLAIIPGVAFDKAGHRLGRGKGYYDRMLADTAFDNVPKVGLCFDFQLVDHLPVDEHDRPVDRVIVIPTT